MLAAQILGIGRRLSSPISGPREISRVAATIDDVRALLLLLVGCWTGAVVSPEAPAAEPRPAPSNRFAAKVRAIRRCSPTGPRTLLFAFERSGHRGFEVELVHDPADPIPRTVVDGTRATFSPCHSHGCSVAMLTIDELVIGKLARGRFRVAARAGASYADEFDAKWVGTPWDVECPRENI